jgi:hypothetical protein
MVIVTEGTLPCESPDSTSVYIPRLPPLSDAWAAALEPVEDLERRELTERYLERTCGAELEQARQVDVDLARYRVLCDALDVAVPHKQGDPLGALEELLRAVEAPCCAPADAVTVSPRESRLEASAEAR